MRETEESFDKYEKFGAYHWKECDRRYGNYLAYNPPLVARYQVVVDAWKKLGGGGAILDVGCGDGYLMGQLAPYASQVTGVDFEAKAIGFAREKLASRANCRVKEGSGYNLDFESGAFDGVTSTDVIEHLQQPGLHLSEIRRVLKPSGVLILTTPQRQPDRPINPYHVTEYKPEELRQLLTEHFGDVQLTFYWPRFWAKVYRNRIGWRLLKLLAIQLYNPFLGKAGAAPEKFTQILAICRKPA